MEADDAPGEIDVNGDNDDQRTQGMPEFIPIIQVNQWYEEGNYSCRLEHRETSAFELFLDLIVVGVVHQLAEDAQEEVNGHSILRFVIVFLPIWTMVADYRMFINASGVYDIVQRLYSLLLMALIIGYTVNATALPSLEQKSTTLQQSAVQFSTSFFLVAKAIKGVIYLLYGIMLPKFRFHMLLNFACSLVPIALIGTVFGSGSSLLFFILIPVTKMWEEVWSYTEGYFIQSCQKKRFRTSLERTLHIKVGCLVATNVEHVIERASALVEIVLGEAVVSILYSVAQYPGAGGLSTFYGRSILVLMIAFALNWVYFTGELSIYRTHDLRKHWFTSITYINMHWPLCLSLILASSAVTKLVDADFTIVGLRYYWGGGVSVGLFCISVLEILHQRNSQNSLWSMATLLRSTIRIGACISFCVTPGTSLSNLNVLSVGAGAMVIVIVESSFGHSVTEARMRLSRGLSRHATTASCPPDLEHTPLNATSIASSPPALEHTPSKKPLNASAAPDVKHNGKVE